DGREDERAQREGDRRESLVDRRFVAPQQAQHDVDERRKNSRGDRQADAEQKSVDNEARHKGGRWDALGGEDEDVDREREAHPRDERDENAGEAEVFASELPGERPGADDRAEHHRAEPAELAGALHSTSLRKAAPAPPRTAQTQKAATPASGGR